MITVDSGGFSLGPGVAYTPQFSATLTFLVTDALLHPDS